MTRESRTLTMEMDLRHALRLCASVNESNGNGGPGTDAWLMRQAADKLDTLVGLYDAAIARAEAAEKACRQATTS